MAKTDVQRITDTLTFLQNTAIVTLAERTDAHQLAQDYLNTPFLNPGTPTYIQLSDNLSLGFRIMPDPNEHRQMARALFLLWKAMEHSAAATWTLPRLPRMSWPAVSSTMSRTTATSSACGGLSGMER